MRNIEVIALTGLDAAIIGTTAIGDREVLAYDFDKCVALLSEMGHDEFYIEEYVAGVQSAQVEGAPVFIYLDPVEEINGGTPPEGTVFH